MSTPAVAQVDWIALPLFVSWPVHTEGWRPSPPTLSKVCSASAINRRNMLCGDQLAPELPVERPHLQSLCGTRLGVDSRPGFVLASRETVLRSSRVILAKVSPHEPSDDPPEKSLSGRFSGLAGSGPRPLLPGADRQGLALRDLHPQPLSDWLPARRGQDRLLAVGQSAQ